jgi:hypothetical protein
MPETHTSKSTAPDGESPEKPTMIDHPAPDGESPGTELGTKPEIRDGGERLTRIITKFGRLATGRPSYESKTGNSQTPESSKLPEQPKPPADERQRLRAVLRAAGKLGSKAKAESEPPTRKDVLAALRGGTTKTSRPAPKPQTREEVLAALRGEYSSPAVEKANSGSDSSVADTESEPPALEDQEESGSSNEQDDSPDKLSADEQSPSASEALKALAEADDTRICIRNMSYDAERIVRTLKRSEIPLSSNNNLQKFASGVSTMLNRLDGVVEEARNGLPLDEASRLGGMGDRIGEIKHALTVLNNAVADQGRHGHSNEDEDYLPYAMKLRDSITELQRFMNVLVERQEK